MSLILARSTVPRSQKVSLPIPPTRVMTATQTAVQNRLAIEWSLLTIIQARLSYFVDFRYSCKRVQLCLK